MGLEGFFKEVEKGEGCLVKVNNEQSRFNDFRKGIYEKV